MSRPRTATARRLLITTLAGVALIAALGGYVTAQRRLPPPEPPPARVLPDPNGWELCSAALAEAAPLLDHSTLTVPNANVDDLRAALAPHLSALAAVRASLKYQFALPTAGEYDPAWGRPRRAAQAFVAESRLAMADGRPAAAIDHAIDAIELGQRLLSGGGGDPAWVVYGSACTSIGGAQVQHTIGDRSANDTDRAGHRLDEVIARLPSSAALLEIRRLDALRVARIGFEDGNAGIEVLLDDTENANALLEVVRIVFYPRGRAYRHLDAHYRARIEAVRRPYPERAAPPPREWAGQSLFPSLASTSLGDTTATEMQAEGVRARLRLLRCELALAAHRLRHGAYPAALADLDGVSEAARIDPFAAAPFRYRREGDAYLLYSIGPDGVDDGGGPPIWNSAPTAMGDLVAGKLWRPAAR